MINLKDMIVDELSMIKDIIIDELSMTSKLTPELCKINNLIRSVRHSDMMMTTGRFQLKNLKTLVS